MYAVRGRACSARASRRIPRVRVMNILIPHRCPPPTQAIKEKLLELEFTDCHVFVRNVDSQTSGPDGGIIVYVSGVLVSTGEGEGAATATEGARRKFSQTFFLAPQPRGYYVLNDILRFAEEAGVAAVAEEAVAAVVEEVATAVETRVVEEIVEKATVVEASATQPIAAEKTEVVAPATPVETKKEDVAKEVCKKEAATALTPAATTADAPKKSWASLAVNGSERWADNKLAAAAKAKASAAAAAKPVAIVAPPSSSSSSSNGLSARPAMPQRRETLTVAKRVYSVEGRTTY